MDLRIDNKPDAATSLGGSADLLLRVASATATSVTSWRCRNLNLLALASRCMPNPIPITTLFVGVLALAQVPLTVLVSYLRGKTGIQFLDGGNETLLRRIRAHANFTETVPITLLAMACAELAGHSTAALWRGGVCLVVGRAIHVWAALNVKGWGLPRIVAMVLTFYAMAGFAVACIRASWPLAAAGA